MPDKEQKVNRREQILACVAEMLEATPGGRITTSKLAAKVGVSEAALYRHFPSKAKMFEGLIEFIEDTIFTRINLINSNEPDPVLKCEKVVSLLLGFCERNPGITRMLTGDALAGETDRLRKRVQQFFDRIETQLKQILRDAEIKQGTRTALSVSNSANLMLAVAEGRISQFVRSEFKRKPTEAWPDQWNALARSIFAQRPSL